MLTDLNDSDTRLQSKLRSASKLVRDFLSPNPQVLRICDELGYEFRDRIYNPMITVWMFVTQVISADKSCQKAVTRLNAWRVAKGLPKVSSETTSYCKARSRLPEALFERLLRWTATRCEEATDETWLFCDRVVEMVDGWTVTMADSEENQEEYPQLACQKPGCGFPIARMIGLFSLATGAINFTAMAAYQGKQTGETSLLRIILDRILPGRILLADRYYASFWLLAMSELRNIDLVARAHHLRKVDFRCGLKQGYLDQIVAYHRPRRPSWMQEKEYRKYPKTVATRAKKILENVGGKILGGVINNLNIVKEDYYYYSQVYHYFQASGEKTEDQDTDDEASADETSADEASGDDVADDGALNDEGSDEDKV